jgi:hypothetical protein
MDPCWATRSNRSTIGASFSIPRRRATGATFIPAICANRIAMNSALTMLNTSFEAENSAMSLRPPSSRQMLHTPWPTDSLKRAAILRSPVFLKPAPAKPDKMPVRFQAVCSRKMRLNKRAQNYDPAQTRPKFRPQRRPSESERSPASHGLGQTPAPPYRREPSALWPRHLPPCSNPAEPRPKRVG